MTTFEEDVIEPEDDDFDDDHEEESVDPPAPAATPVGAGGRPLTMLLPVPLTVDEQLSIGDQMSAILTALEQVKEKKRAAVSEFNAEIKGHEGALHNLNEAKRTGHVEREIGIREEPDYHAGIMRTVRIDTGVVVRTRPLESHERQAQLFTGGETAPSAVAAARDAEEDLEAEAAAKAGGIDKMAIDAVRIDEALKFLEPRFEVEQVGDYFVASVETPTWVAEMDGNTDGDARANLRAKCRNILTAERELEAVEKARTEAAADAAAWTKVDPPTKAKASGTAKRKKRGNGEARR